MQKRKELLEKHPYSIWEDKNGIWHTYIPDKKKGRVPRKRNSRIDIEDVVIEYLKEEENNPTVEDVFNDWIERKHKLEDISNATKDRYKRQFEQCFDKFGKRKIKLVSECDVEDFILDTIHDCKLTKKGYGNFRTLMYGIFRHAKKKGFVNYSITDVVSDIEISKNSFRNVDKEDNEQVFMLDEIPSVVEYLENNMDIINLGLLLLFKTGLRIGELSALKREDIYDGVIHVIRTEISYKNGKEQVYEVRNSPKSEAGIREVVIPNKCTWILDKIIMINPFGEYLFEKNEERIRTYIFRNRLYRVCKETNIVKKSPHKIRKTYGTLLIDANIPDSVVIKQMGHTDIGTTKEYYYKNMRNKQQIQEEINKIECLAN